MGKHRREESPHSESRRKRSRSRSTSRERKEHRHDKHRDKHRDGDGDRETKRHKDTAETKREEAPASPAPPSPAPPSPAPEVKAETDVEKAAKLAALKQQIAMKMSKLNQIKAQQQLTPSQTTPIATQPSLTPTSPPPLPTSPAPQAVVPSVPSAALAVSPRVNVVNQRLLQYARPMSLILDAQGRQIDSRGNLIVFDKSETATTLANRRQFKDVTKEKAPPVAKEEVVVEDITTKAFCDPRMRVPSLARKKKGTLNFVKPGKYIRKAENIKHRQVMRQLGLDAKLAAEVAEDDDQNIDINPNLIELASVKPKRDAAPVPLIEWWDQRILPKSCESYASAGTAITAPTATPAKLETAEAMDIDDESIVVVATKENTEAVLSTAAADQSDEVTDLLCGWSCQTIPPGSLRFTLRGGAITSYIHHPQPLEHPFKKKEGKPLPVMLTKKVLCE